MDQEKSAKLDALVGTLDKLVFRSNDTGFSVFSLTTSGGAKITILGSLPDLHQGERVSLRGTWGFHKKFGRQFTVSEYDKELPYDVVGIEKYLSSGMIRGIGPQLAGRLVSAFGAKTLEVIDKKPELLLKVNGVGEKRVDAIASAWQEQKEISRVMVFLKSKGVTTAFASKIFKKYGHDSIDVLKRNPYQLVEDIWGVGFKMADSLAISLEIGTHSPERVHAGILHLITSHATFGHLYITQDELFENLPKLLDIKIDNHHKLIESTIESMINSNKLKKLSLEDETIFTLPQYFGTEMGIVKNIERLLSGKSRGIFDLDKIYKEIRAAKDESSFCLNEGQQHGIMTTLQSKISVITGGPGTGKTTLLKSLVSLLEGSRVRYRLTAPTGRAAKRMFEGTGKNAETIHRLLEFTPQFMGFSRNENNTLDTEFLIIDEASMIDAFLMHALIKAIPAHAQVLIIGDVDQLPSVGAGNVLHDIIASDKVPITRLTEIFRQAQDSLIIMNAHKINSGEFPHNDTARKDFFFVKRKDPEEIFPLLRWIYDAGLKKQSIDPKDAIVLTPMNRGIAGTQRINQELQMILNPPSPDKPQIERFGIPYRVGDRVMQIRNNYDKFAFNGDLGTLTEINTPDQQATVQFGTRSLTYDLAELNELVLAYAVSIHKSQGSEFPAVIIPIFMQHFVLLQRNLLYTAVTRAKRLCILVGESRAIAMTVKNDKGKDRHTLLKDMLTKNVPN